MNGTEKLYILLNVYAALFDLYQPIKRPKILYFFKIELFQSSVLGLIIHPEKVTFYSVITIMESNVHWF